MEFNRLYLNLFTVDFKIKRHSQTLFYNPFDYRPHQKTEGKCCQCIKDNDDCINKDCLHKEAGICTAKNEIKKDYDSWDPPDLCPPNTLIWKKKIELDCEDTSGKNCKGGTCYGCCCKKGYYYSNQLCGVFQERENCALNPNQSYKECLEFRNDEDQNHPAAGWASCRYMMPIINIKAHSDKVIEVKKWIDDVKNGTTMVFTDPIDQYEIIVAFSYFYTWFFSFYKTIYYSNLITSFDIFSDDDEFLRKNIIYTLSPNKTLDFADFTLKYMTLPIPALKDKTYTLDIFLDPDTFFNVFHDKDFIGIKNAITVILNNFFKEKKGQSDTPIQGFEFDIHGISVFVCTGADFNNLTQNSFFEVGIADHPLFINLDNQLKSKGGSTWNPNIKESYNIPYDNKISFIPLYKVKIVITRWSPILLIYFLNRGIQMIDCEAVYEDIGMDPITCLNCLNNVQDCKSKLERSCVKSYFHPDFLRKTTTLLLQNTNRKCYCYASNLTPPLIDRYGNKTSICFDTNCTSDDRKNYNIRDDTCTNECQLMYNWLHNKDPAYQPRNPMYFDKARFEAICGVQYKPFRYNDVINVNFFLCSLGICICLFFILFHLKNRKWYVYFFIPFLLFGICVYISIDMRGSSQCNDNKQSICTSKISKLKIPNYFCDSVQNCECLSVFSCGSRCLCQNQRCVPKFDIMDPQKIITLYKLRVNYMFILFLIFFIVTSSWVVAKARLTSLLITILSLTSLGVVVLSYFFMLPTSVEYNYKDICHTAEKIIIGNISTNETNITLLMNYDSVPTFINARSVDARDFVFSIPYALDNEFVLYVENASGKETRGNTITYDYCIMPLAIDQNISFDGYVIEAGKAVKNEYKFDTSLFTSVFFSTVTKNNRFVYTKIIQRDEKGIVFKNYNIENGVYTEIDEDIEIHVVLFGLGAGVNKPKFVYGLSQNVLFAHNIKNPIVITGVLSRDISLISALNIKEITDRTILVNVYTKTSETDFKRDQKNNLISYMIFEETKKI